MQHSAFSERNDHVQRNFIEINQNQSEDERNQDLERHFLPDGQAFRALLRNLDKVIHKTDESEAQRHKDNREDSGILDCEDKACNSDSGNNHQAAHIRRTVFTKMRLRPFSALCLLYFQFSKLWNQEVSCDRADRECQQHRQYRIQYIRKIDHGFCTCLY